MVVSYQVIFLMLCQKENNPSPALGKRSHMNPLVTIGVLVIIESLVMGR